MYACTINSPLLATSAMFIKYQNGDEHLIASIEQFKYTILTYAQNISSNSFYDDQDKPWSYLNSQGYLLVNSSLFLSLECISLMIYAIIRCTDEAWLIQYLFINTGLFQSWFHISHAHSILS